MNAERNALSAVNFAQTAIDSARANSLSDLALRPFTMQFEECEKHGKYPLNTQDERGQERWFAGSCPTCRKQENAARLLANSNIPRRFLDCDFCNYEATTSEQQLVLNRCKEYANDFAKYRETGTCLLLCGRTGTGKNHLATAITRQLLAAGYSVLRIKASEYFDAYWSKAFDERETWLKNMASVDLLIMDEIGRSSNAKSAKDAFFRLLDARYEAQLPNLLATNHNREELIDILGTAAYDRLTERGGVRLTLDWESYRAKKEF
ncbi:ATP-binding protein [Mycoavidus sp. HKI]|uniref:ATP-binding protein n=1 Tax=Mycoavidus sp. HKI TaxID=2840467 RepID=UPI001CC17D0E|nr:ATP-binding protein [Mycoavidus sp. HKI]UAW63468.1 ATP-binding protein [Mycoavidus sp. HKI]